MKFNWGTGIALFYSCFVVVMVSMVIRSAQNKVELVQENYYDKDLHYEAFRQKRQNASHLDSTVAWEFLKEQKLVRLTFPLSHQKATGNLTFYRPSDHLQDHIYPIQLDKSAALQIPTDQISSGLWRIKLTWEVEGRSYFKEEKIVL